MSNDKNMFGGKNPLGLYVPMTEDEQEVLERLVEHNDLELVIHGWTTLPNPRIRYGDLRVSVVFRLHFHGKPSNIYYLDLELRTRTGITLFRQKMPLIQNGKPVTVQEGMYLDLAWDIAVDHMDPKLVKLIKPGALGLTSRRIDKDTGARTLVGNMKLNTKEKNFIHAIDKGSEKVRQEDAARLSSIIEKSETDPTTR